MIAAREAQLARLAGQHAGRARAGRLAGVQDYCRVRQAAAKVERARERQAQRQAAGPGPARNITDPDSRLMPTRNGFIQGYNTQNVTSEDGLVIATELTGDPADMAWYEPMMGKAAQAAALIEANRPAAAPGQDRGSGQRGIGQALADAGYCSEDNLTCPGPDRLIAVGKRRDLEQAARGQDHDDGPGQDRGGPAVRAMRERLRTEEGIAAYRQRGHIAETPHGHIKHNMGFRQLSMRGKDKAAAEWTFTCAVHNLFKALTAGHLTPAALASLAADPGQAPHRQATRRSRISSPDPTANSATTRKGTKNRSDEGRCLYRPVTRLTHSAWLVNRSLPVSTGTSPSTSCRRSSNTTHPEMTALYARLSDKTVREHWEKARKVSATGQPVQLSPDGPLGDSAWPKHQLSRATRPSRTGTASCR